MKIIDTCIICASKDNNTVFKKTSAMGDEFTLVKCSNCGLKFLSQVPDEREISYYYKKTYFTKRTERGYDNYFSGSTKNEIERVFKLNLADLGFYKYENRLKEKRRSLDIGCAAGYFVNFLKGKGWHSYGIDISKDCVDFANRLGLNVRQGDYMKINFSKKFDLITLWSTIEHLHRPDLILKKAYKDLKKDGILYISTCRADGFNFMKLFGKKWRFYNFPEHMFFFSYQTLKKLLVNSGFAIMNYKTYGSNLGKSGSWIRKAADFIAKKFYLGDMMIVSAKKYEW
ncbi:MAG: class I SAM-dependent methyltransferase [Spirochaetes bacterium]|nr:class I SAM-dependent methyltransferase [Spirochaetota bacterium]